MINLVEVISLGDDKIEVHGFDDANPTELIVANGWLSATTNHYDAEDYAEDGSLREDATPREMTDKEKREYFVSLLASKVVIENKPIAETLFVDEKNKEVHASAVAEAEKVPEEVDETEQVDSKE